MKFYRKRADVGMIFLAGYGRVSDDRVLVGDLDKYVPSVLEEVQLSKEEEEWTKELKLGSPVDIPVNAWPHNDSKKVEIGSFPITPIEPEDDRFPDSHRIELTPEAFDMVSDLIENPPPPTPALVELIRKAPKAKKPKKPKKAPKIDTPNEE